MVWWKLPGSWGREIGGMVQGIGTAGRSFWRRPWLKRGCCANGDDTESQNMFTNRNVTVWCVIRSVHVSLLLPKMRIREYQQWELCLQIHTEITLCVLILSSYASHLLVFDSDKLQLCLKKYFRRQVLAVKFFLAAFVMKCVVAVLPR